MKIVYNIFLLAVFAFASLCLSSKDSIQDIENNQLWLDCSLKGIVSFEIFNSAILGKSQIDYLMKKNIITIIDFSKPSTDDRFFVIDVESKRLLYKCLVAHGKNSGENYAKNFSNEFNSLQSSLGFYLTAETYSGENGYSLRLDGLEKGINNNAREREIVIHGADYVSMEFINKYGRIGRSWGCPALPVDISKLIIDMISDGSCLFIYGDDKYYREHSDFINKK